MIKQYSESNGTYKEQYEILHSPSTKYNFLAAQERQNLSCNNSDDEIPSPLVPVVDVHGS